MRPQLIMAAFAIYITGTLMSLIASGIWFGTGEVGIINQLAGYSVINMQSLGGLTIAKPALDWFNAISTIVTWNYPYLNNPAGFIVKLFMYVVSIGVIIAIWQMFILVMQGAASLLKTIISPGS